MTRARTKTEQEPICAQSRIAVKAYDVMARAVEDGIAYGFNRAYKHSDQPQRLEMEQAVYDAVMGEISSWFQFREDE